MRVRCCLLQASLVEAGALWISELPAPDDGNPEPSIGHWNLLTSSDEVVGRMMTSGTASYYLKDHLGSVRAVVNASGAVLETRDYYPYGLEMPGRSFVSGTKAKENFTGHELDAESGLLYAGARYYMPNIGRWTSVDPLARQYPAHSPYVYVANNPLRYIDPDGREWLTPEDERKAQRLQRHMERRIASLERQNTRLQQRLESAEAKGNDQRVARLRDRMDDNSEQITHLSGGIGELQHLGETSDFVFTFSATESNGHVRLLSEDGSGGKPLIALEHSSMAIAAHEARHAYEYITTGISRGTMRFSPDAGNLLVYTSLGAAAQGETRAYRLQYSFSRASLQGFSPPRGVRGITPEWIRSMPGNPYGF